MITALYTETLEEFLKRNEESEVWQALVQKFNKFPAFNLSALNFNFYNLFKDKYEIREIGAETESLFVHFVKDTLNETLIAYVPKIDLYLANFSKLMDRKISLAQNYVDERVMDRTIAGTEDDNEKKTTALNPITNLSGVGNARSATVDTVTRDNANSTDEDSTYTVTFNGTKEQALMFFKNNPELLEKAMEIRDIYLDALSSFEKCFMGIY